MSPALYASMAASASGLRGGAPFPNQLAASAEGASRQFLQPPPVFPAVGSASQIPNFHIPVHASNSAATTAAGTAAGMPAPTSASQAPKPQSAELFETALKESPKKASSKKEPRSDPSISADGSEATKKNSGDGGVGDECNSGSAGLLTGRPPVILYMPCDDAVISPYQCLARQQMELFEAQEVDVEAGAQGRNRGIVLGQVGIRCKHCSHLYPRRRTKSSTFYPSKLKSIYQTAQNMANTHLTQTCLYIPKSIKEKLLKLSQDKKTSAGGGKEYWSDGARILGVYETESLLRFHPHNDYPGTMGPAVQKGTK